MAQWLHKAREIWVNIGSGNGLLPDSTKSLRETMLIKHQWGSVAFTRSAQATILYEFENAFQISQEPKS